MSTEQNKIVAKAFLTATFKRDPEQVAATLSDDFGYTIGGKNARFQGARTKPQWCDYLRNPNPFTEELKLTIHRVLADGDTVAVECESHGVIAAGGKVYNNTYTFWFTVRGGRITAIREYMDTNHVLDVLPTVPKT
jgi:ketosteroid isomerase-like protein